MTDKQMTDPPGTDPPGTDPPPPATELVPTWMSHLAALGWRVLAIIALGFVLVSTAVLLGTVTATIFVGLLASVALLPVVRSLRRRGLPPAVAGIAAAVLGIVVVVIALVALVLLVAPYVDELVRGVREGLADLRSSLVGLGVPDLVLTAFDRLVAAIVGLFEIDVFALAGSAITVGTVAILSGFLTIFLLSDGDRGWASVTRTMAPAQATALTSAAVAGLDRVSGYVRRTGLLAVVDALVVLPVLLVLNVPQAGPLTAVVFVSGFVPYLGAIVSTTIVVLFTLAFAGPIGAAIVLAAVIATSVIAGRLLRNTGMGEAVDVHPLLVLVAIPTGAALFGVLGLIGLLPVIVFILAVSKSIVFALSFRGNAAPAPASGIVPMWLDRLAQWSWRSLIVAGLIFVLIEVTISIPGVIVPLVLACVVAATLAPLASRLRGWGVGRSAAAAGATLGAALVVLATIAVAIVWTIDPMREIVQTALDGAEEVHLEFLTDAVGSIGSAILVAATIVLRSLPRLLFVLVLVPLIGYFLLRDGGALWHRALDRVTGHRRERLDLVGTRAVNVLGGYMIGTAVISLFGAVTSALIMVLLGLPLAIPIGILTFFGGFIPLVGSAVTSILAYLVAVAVGTPFDLVVMGIWTLVFNIVQGNLVTPLVYGRSFSLHPAIILLAIPAGSELAGVLGMFLVVPFVAIIAATWRPILDLLEADPGPMAPTSSPAPDTPDAEELEPDPATG